MVDFTIEQQKRIVIFGLIWIVLMVIGLFLTSLTTIPLFKNLAMLFPFFYAYIRITYESINRVIHREEMKRSRDNLKWDSAFAGVGLLLLGFMTFISFQTK